MQGILILAHKNFDQVLALSKLLRECFEVYIHFDIKMLLTKEQQESLKEIGVHFISEIDVHWGSWSIGEAMQRLMKLALSNPNITHVHIISGQDWPVQSVDKINQFFIDNDNIYLGYKNAAEEIKSGEHLIWWQQFYFNYDKVRRQTLYGKVYHRLSILFQRALRVNKLKKLHIRFPIYSGPNWCDLPRDAALYCVTFLDENPNFVKMLKTGYCSDEFWLPTILCNNEVYHKRIIKDIHRFIVWENRNGSYPAILDETDFRQLSMGNYFFARKFDPTISQKLIELLEK